MAWKCVKYFLDNLVNSLLGCIFQGNCRCYTKCKDCKNIKTLRMVAWNGVSSVKIEKACEIIVKNATRYMEIVNVILNTQKLKIAVFTRIFMRKKIY